MPKGNSGGRRSTYISGPLGRLYGALGFSPNKDGVPANPSKAAATQALNAAMSKGDYDGNGNQDLIKYQQQSDDKTGSFLSSVWKNTDFANYQDGYTYRDNSLQKLVLRLGLNDAPTVLSDKDFKDYVSRTGAPVLYRGFQRTEAMDRTESAKYNHVGNGIYGDGHYMSTSKATAQTYGGGAGLNMQMALSPNARVVNLSEVRRAIQNASQNLQRSLSYSGSQGSRSYGGNNGEAQMALKMGYNVVHVDTYGGDYYYAITRDALVINKKRF